MERRQLIDLCLRYPGAYEDYPFRDDNWAAGRHGPGGAKCLPLYTSAPGGGALTQNANPMRANFYRRVYTDVCKGYHLNHRHWNTVYLNGDLPIEELENMPLHSYHLPAPVQRGNCNKIGLEKSKESE